MAAAAATVCLLLTLSGMVSSEPDERLSGGAPCPALCTCHQTPHSQVPLVRYHQTGESEHDSQHHWDFYHHHEGLNHSSVEDEHEEELVLSVVCALQLDTNTPLLLTSLPADTKFLSLLQAPDLQPTYLRAADLAGLAHLEGLEIHGYHAHDDYNHEHAAAADLHGNHFAAMLARADRHRGLLPAGQPARALITLSADALRPLTDLAYLSLEHVLLSPDASGPDAGEYQLVAAAGEAEPRLLVAEQPRVVSYDEFRLHTAPRYSNFANLTALRFLRLAHAGLEELSWQLFEGLTELRHLRLEHQLVRTLPDFAFFGCPNLRRLSLAGNRLLSVNMKSFAGLLDLETLDLSDNLLSELSYVTFAPFPRLRELSLLGNPVTAVLEGALDMMNGTEVLRLGAADTPLTIRPRALRQLTALRQLNVANVTLSVLTGELLSELPQLTELELHGSITELQFDAFTANPLLERVDLSRCQLEDVSQDAFLGLTRLTVLDLSHNALTELASEVFSPLTALRELYLHHNQLSWLTADVLGPVRPKLLQLQHNPWECSCQLAFLSAAMTNKARSSHATVCRWDSSAPGGRICEHEHRAHLTYDARLEPRCHQPAQYRHWGLYEVLQRELRCRRQPPPPPAARSRHHPHGEDLDYLAAPDADVVLPDEPSDYEDYGDYEDYAATIADEELAMAEYAADDYEDYETAGIADEGLAIAENAADNYELEPELELEPERTTTKGYVPISPELFAKLSKKAQKLEWERMNPKFRRHYNL